MVLPIVNYGHPVLRQKGQLIDAVTDETRALIEDMFETMYGAAGIGLAAQQIGKALQLTVIDVREVTDRPSSLEIEGKAAPVEQLMPLVLINPRIHPTGDTVSGPEGCLSFPEIYSDISRPEGVDVTALDRDGKTISFHAGGLLSRAIQHEVDHLNGILFIDRMPSDVKSQLKEELEALRKATQAALKA